MTDIQNLIRTGLTSLRDFKQDYERIPDRSLHGAESNASGFFRKFLLPVFSPGQEGLSLRRKPLFPDFVELCRGINIADAVFGNLPEKPFLYHLRNIIAGDSLGLG